MYNFSSSQVYLNIDHSFPNLLLQYLAYYQIGYAQILTMQLLQPSTIALALPSLPPHPIKLYVLDRMESQLFCLDLKHPQTFLNSCLGLILCLLKILLVLFMLYNVTALYIRIIMAVSPLIVIGLIRMCLKVTGHPFS